MPSETRILLAEDDEYDARLTLRVLATAPEAEAVVVPDGKEALDYLLRRGHYAEGTAAQPSLVLLDLKMPRVDGFGVLTEMKTDPTLRIVPAVMLTSSRQPADLTRAYALGANAYVVKSINFDQYIATLGSVIRFWLRVNDLPPPCLPRVRTQPAKAGTPAVATGARAAQEGGKA